MFWVLKVYIATIKTCHLKRNPPTHFSEIYILLNLPDIKIKINVNVHKIKWDLLLRSYKACFGLINYKACFGLIPGFPLYLSMKMCIFYCYFSFNATKMALRSVKSKQSCDSGLPNWYFSFPNNIFGVPSMFWCETYAIYR